MALKNYDTNALVQRMVDVYVDTIRYHNAHWQELNGHHKSYGTLGAADAWINVPNDTIFITNIYQEILHQLLRLEVGNTVMINALLSVPVASFISAAQTQFLV